MIQRKRAVIDRPYSIDSFCYMPLETIFQRELNYARVHTGGRNLAEGAGLHVGKRICGPRSVVRIRELRMIECVEEFGSELDGMILFDVDPFQKG